MTHHAGNDPLVLTNQTPIGARLLFGCVGLLPLIWPAWNLQPWNIPFGLLAVFFWIIVLGAIALGGAIILFMAFAPNQRLTITHDGITLDRQSIFGTSHRRVDASDVAEVVLKRSEWQDGADSFSIRVTLNGTSNFVTAPITSEDRAQQLLKKTEAALAALRSGG